MGSRKFLKEVKKMNDKVKIWKTLFAPALSKENLKNLLPPDPLNGIDIEKEYKLIKQKKSNLPRRLREMIIERMEK